MIIQSLLRRGLSWLPASAQNPAYMAALGLVAIQVGIGIILKAAQTGGTYAFSPSASVTISEFLKMVLSTIFFHSECRRRARDKIGPSTRGGGDGYTSLGGVSSHGGASDLPTSERESFDDKEREDSGFVQAPPANGHAPEKHSGPLPKLDLRTFWSYVRGEVTVDVRYGFCNLALFYVLINNSVWLPARLAFREHPSNHLV